MHKDQQHITITLTGYHMNYKYVKIKCNEKKKLNNNNDELIIIKLMIYL